MIRSFHYVTYAGLLEQLAVGHLSRESLPRFEPWAYFWYRWIAATYLRAYLEVMSKTDLLPRSKQEIGVMLDAHLLEKAVYEVGYELNNRPNWAKIPLQGILQLFERTNR